MEFILLSLCWRQIIVPLMQGFWHWNHENGIEWSNVPHLLSDVILFSDNEEGFPSFCWSFSSQTLSPRQLSRFWRAGAPVLFVLLMYLRFGWKSFSFNLKYGLDPGPWSLRHHRHDFGDCFLFTVFCHSWFMNTWTKDHISPAAVLHAAAYITARNSCIVARSCPCMGPILSDRIFNTFYVDIL